jgi:indolepyruvate ferredoxin oxidoreductase, beta subunit
MINRFNVFLIGVGGQGIGLLSELLVRTGDHAGLKVSGVDTHGLAQRGGTVTSHIRIGDDIHSPLIPLQQADLVVSLERHEALRGVVDYGKEKGTLIYYDAIWQPLPVRLKGAKEIDRETVSSECRKRQIREVVFKDDEIADPRMQNMAIAAKICALGLIPGLKQEHYEKGMADIFPDKIRDKNLKLFRRIIGDKS